MALLPVCSTLSWKADGILPLRAVVQSSQRQYVSPMTNGRNKRATERNPAGASRLVAVQCPACHMLSWHNTRSNHQSFCAFCSNSQPAYLTKVSPEPIIMTTPKPTEIFSTRHRHGPTGQCDGASPFILEFFMVQGSGFRCMAYRNNDGKWRGAFDNEVLPGAIRVLE